MTIHYYNITNNTGSPIRLPSHQLVDATATVQINLVEYRTYSEQDDEFLEQIYNGDLSVTFGPSELPVHTPIHSDGNVEVLRDTDKIKTIEVDDSTIADGRGLIYNQSTDTLEYSDIEGEGWHEDTIFTSCIDFSVMIDINGNVMRSIL